jgi:hypothetical protein
MRAIGQLVQPTDQGAVGVVLGEPHLLEDDLALGVELGLGEVGVDGDVGQQLQASAEVLGRQHDVVVGVVVRGEGVALPAQPLDETVDRAGWSGRRALEEHVLEVVGEPELVRGLVAAARPQPELERHHLAGAVLVDDHHDAAGQNLAAGPGALACPAAGGAGDEGQGQGGQGRRSAHLSPPR